MSLDISAETPRVQYTVTSADSTFDYDFEIFQDSDIKVFVDSTLKTLTTHYTVSGAGTTGGGTVTMTSGNAVTNATVTLVRDITIQRTTDFPASGAFQVDSLNTELDRITAVQQTLEDNIARSLRLADEDATATLNLPLKDARKGRYLAFNATTGNAEAGPTQTDATAIASVTSDIALLADIQDGTTATNAITTVATASGNIQTVATANSAINTIATGTTGGNSNLTNLNTIATGTTGGNANLTQINAVASDLTDINTVASKATEIGRLGTSDAVADMALLGDSAIITDMGLLAVDTVIADMALLADPAVITDMDLLGASGVIGNIASVSGKITEIGALGTNANITNMTALNGTNVITHMANLNGTNVISNISNLNGTGVLTNIANLNATGVLTNIANLNASGVIANIGTVAGVDTEIGQLAPKATDISTVAGKITDVEAVAHLEDGTTATSAVSTLSARSSDIQALAPRASDLQALSPKATEIQRIGATSANITALTTLGTTDAVSDMNALANITSDISALAGALEQTYTITVASVGGANRFILSGSNYPAIEMFRGSSYTFNQNDATNDGHPLVFKNGSSAYQDGVTYYLNGAVTSYSNYINTTTFNAGRSSGDRKVVIEVQSTAPSSGLRYYCYVHGNGMGNTITVKDSNISLVATNIANVNLTGGSIGNVNSVAGALTNINAVANNSTNINTVAGDATEITAVANNATNINAVAGNASNINTVAGDSSDINAVAGNATNINAVASNATNINTVAGANANVSTVATNISSVNDFADKYRIGSSDPSSSLDEGDLFYNTTSNVLKVYTGSAWEAGVTAGSGFAPLSGATFTGAISGTSATFSDNIISRKANDVELVVHSDTTTTPVSEIQLMRGTNNTWGADIYTDWKIDNGYGSSGSSAGTLRLARGYNGSTTTIMELGPPSSSSAKFYAPLTVGVDDTGHDVKFFGATSGKYMEWDASADQLDVTGSFDVTGNSSFTGTVDVDANLKANSLSIDHSSNDWNFELSGADLVIKNGSTTLFKLDTSGNLTVAGDITTDGSL